MSTRVLKPAFVDAFPSTLAPDTFYISIEFSSCAHLCACGCGREVITPLSPAQWSFIYNGQDVSVRPSIGNWGLDCRSHYTIDNGRVVWSRTFSDDEIATNRARDRRAVRRLDRQTAQADGDTAPDTAPDTGPNPASNSADRRSPSGTLSPLTTPPRSTTARPSEAAGLWWRVRSALKRAGR